MMQIEYNKRQRRLAILFGTLEKNLEQLAKFLEYYDANERPVDTVSGENVIATSSGNRVLARPEMPHPPLVA